MQTASTTRNADVQLNGEADSQINARQSNHSDAAETVSLKTSPLELLQTIYIQLNPRFHNGEGAECMTTAAMVAQLRSLSLSEVDRESAAAPSAAFNQLDQAFLKKNLTL